MKIQLAPKHHKKRRNPFCLFFLHALWKTNLEDCKPSETMPIFCGKQNLSLTILFHEQSISIPYLSVLQVYPMRPPESISAPKQEYLNREIHTCPTPVTLEGFETGFATNWILLAQNWMASPVLVSQGCLILDNNLEAVQILCKE